MPKPTRRTVGIDPGRRGGLAIIGQGRNLVDYFQFEKLSLQQIQKEITRRVKPTDLVCMEQPAYFQGAGDRMVSWAAKMHENSGFCYGVCLTLGAEVVHYVPQKWQKPLHVPPGLTYEARKEFLLLAALDVFPQLGNEYKYVQKGVCDAVIIALYGHYDKQT